MSKLKTLVAAAAITAAPAAAFAEGCAWHQDRQANITCAPGSTYDAGAGTCVANPTG